MKELALEYGYDPDQKPSRIFMEGSRKLPITILSGRLGYIGFMDALNSWQLVKELKIATRSPVTASLKYVSPAGAAVGLPLDGTLRKIYWVDDMDKLSSLANAYARTRGADRMSSFKDFISLSDVRNTDTARIVKWEVSDGTIAPGYEPEALEILKFKKNGNYNVVQIDSDYEPKVLEHKQVFGITFKQGHGNLGVNRDPLEDVVTENRYLPDSAKIDLMTSLITLKYTQSSPACYARGGQAIDIDAGQQSRIHCTRLAGSETGNWYLRQAPQIMNLPFVDSVERADRDNTIDVYMGDDYMDILADRRWGKTFKVRPPVFTAEEKGAWLDTMTDVALDSNAFFPFGDDIDGASRSGVRYVAQPGGPIRDDQVIGTYNQYGMVMAFMGIRLFHHQ